MPDEFHARFFNKRAIKLKENVLAFYRWQASSNARVYSYKRFPPCRHPTSGGRGSFAIGTADAEVAEAAFVIEGAQGDFAPSEGFVAGCEDGGGGVIEPDGNVAGVGIAHDLDFVPGVFLPRCAGGAEGGDGLAIRVIDEVDLMMRIVGFFAEVGVVELVRSGAGKGDAEVVVPCIETGQLALEGEGKTTPLARLEPGQIEGTAEGGLVGVLLQQEQLFPGGGCLPLPRCGIGELPCRFLGEGIDRQSRRAAGAGAAGRLDDDGRND